MSRRHRFLTTKDVRWQWFNPLVFGMVCEIGEGCDVREALQEAEQMKSAALHFAKHCPGWPRDAKDVGLYVNIFGHNNVNSLFIHILDLTVTGPSFAAQTYKNCPLDAVIKVLQEEAQDYTMPRVVSLAGERKARFSLDALSGGFRGTGGATSLKEELVERVPVLCDSGSFREVRRIFREDCGGCKALKPELTHAGFIDASTGLLTTGTKPFNLFARIAAGEMEQPGMAAEQAALQDFSSSVCICRNKPENDAHWDSEAAEWVGKASMSARHRFLTTKDLRWTFFNALTLGMSDEDGDPDRPDPTSLMESIELLETLKAAALAYVTNMQGWSDKIGLYFHVFGHNSVNSLHLHVVDMSSVGPTFHKMSYKNCPINAVLKVLREELATVQAAERPKLQPKAAAVEESPQAQDAVQELNVAGEVVAVSVATLRRSPPKSFLRALVDGVDNPMLVRDSRGRIFLDFPPDAFKRILNHLRMQHLRPHSTLWCADEETRRLAKSLGFAARCMPNYYLLCATLGVAALCLVFCRK